MDFLVVGLIVKGMEEDIFEFSSMLESWVERQTPHPKDYNTNHYLAQTKPNQVHPITCKNSLKTTSIHRLQKWGNIDFPTQQTHILTAKPWTNP